jgi:hypothetical protein
MPLSVIEEVSDSEQSDSEKPTAEQATHEGLIESKKPSPSIGDVFAYCFNFLGIGKKGLFSRYSGR